MWTIAENDCVHSLELAAFLSQQQHFLNVTCKVLQLPAQCGFHYAEFYQNHGSTAVCKERLEEPNFMNYRQTVQLLILGYERTARSAYKAAPSV